MTNDSAKFRTEAELRQLGAYEVTGGRWEKGTLRWLPLYEGKMVQAYDHRAASVVVNTANVHRPAQPEPADDEQHSDANFIPRPQFFVSAADAALPGAVSAVLAFKDVTAPTNVRTMIAALIPPTGCGNTLPLLLPDLAGNQRSYVAWATLLLANLNSCPLDFVARQKVQGQHLNFYIVEQLPVIPRASYSQTFGTKTAEQIIREDVLALTYTAHDMAAFAADMGHTGPPFPWNPEDRLRRRARLDALFFHLYGLDRDEAGYVMDTFPIVRQQEERDFGRYRSRALVLSYMAALAAGNPDADVVG